MPRTQRLPAAALAAALALAGCGGSSSGSSTSTPQARAAAGPPTVFDPSAFRAGSGAANRWFPLQPGYQSVREGGVNRGHRRLTHRRVLTVTDLTKDIQGVHAVVTLDQDFDAGQLAEQPLDYLATDKDGNVWTLGSYTEAYEGGRFVNANDGWLAGKNGAAAGVLVPAAPRPGSPPFIEAREPGGDAKKAQVKATGQRTCVPFKCYADVLVVREAAAEDKYYAPGVGHIRTESVQQGGEAEVERLVNLTRLSGAGVAEIRRAASKLDRHAAVTMRDAFRDAALARRAG